MIADKTELGALIFPQKKQKKLSAWFIFYILGLFFNLNTWIFNYLSGNQIFSLIGFLCFIYFAVRINFVRIRAFKIYEKGFDTAPTIYQLLVKKVPGFVHIKDIQIITPEYGSYKGEIFIRNYKFFLDAKRFFMLPKKNYEEFVVHAKSTFEHEWDALFDENYDVQNIDWRYIRKNQSFSWGKSLVLFLTPTAVGYTLIMIYLYYSSTTRDMMLDKPTLFPMLFLPMLYIAAISSVFYFNRINRKMVVLTRFIIQNGSEKVPKDILLSIKFRKWVYRSSLTKLVDLNYLDKLREQNVFVSGKMIKTKSISYYRYKLRGLRLQAIVMMVLLGIFTWALAYFGNFSLSIQSDVYNLNRDGVPETGSHFFVNTTTLENDTLVISDNFIIGPRGNVSLANVTVTWDLRSSGSGGLYVDVNGTLYAWNCTFKSENSEKTYKCELYGTAEFIGCEFYNLWGDRDDRAGQGGVEIYSDDVRLDGCYIYKAHVAGIIIGKSSPEITNCTITKCYDDGLEIHGGAAMISNNEIKNNGNSGITVYSHTNSKAILENNSITNNKDHGIIIPEGSNIKLINNHVTKNSNENIYYNKPSNPYCLWTLPIILIPIYVLLPYFSYRNGKRKLLEEMKKLGDEEKVK